jgi:diguanylate cyclase (GGDEF)-like protein
LFIIKRADLSLKQKHLGLMQTKAIYKAGDILTRNGTHLCLTGSLMRYKLFCGIAKSYTSLLLSYASRLQSTRCTTATLFLLISMSIAHATPIVKEPSFQRLSTAHGLSQDTVNALVLDNEGFLWLGTEAGLNRYDGYQNIQVKGPNNEFVDMPVTSLFQDSKGNMWISESIAGVHQYNLTTNISKLLISLPSTVDPDYIQVADKISEDATGDIWFSLDESLVKYSYDTQAITKEFSLPTDKLDADVVRAHIVLPDFLIIGTSYGLIAVNRATKEQTEILFLEKEDRNVDNQNVKTLAIDQFDNFWIGTVEGLYRMSLRELVSSFGQKKLTPIAEQAIKDRNIWAISTDETGLLHIVTDLGYYQLNPVNKKAQHVFLPTDSRYAISNDILKSIVIDNNNNLWIGSGNDGAIYWMQYATEFKNVFNSFGGRGVKIFTDNNVWSLHQQDEETLWIGTKNGLNKYNLLTGETQKFLESQDTKAQYSGSSILNIHPAGDNKLWLQTNDGLIKFDTKTNKSLPIIANNQADQANLEVYLWSSYLADNGDLLLITDEHFLRYSPSSNEVRELEILNSVLKHTATFGFKPSDKKNTHWVSAYGELWAMDETNDKLTLVHSLDSVHKKARIYPSDMIIDDNNILWVAYPSIGLYGLDANTYEQKYFFDKSNVLPTNVIFDLNADYHGNIWMASNTGLLRLSTDDLQIERFDQNNGLINSDFNIDASIVLHDGRMVYGSPKGITIFDPQNIEPTSIKHQETTITNVTLSTKPLDLPFNALNKQTIEFAHDDVGLNIYFSTLQYDSQQNVKYKYELTGDEDIVYPTTSQSNIMFPRLEPGKYKFLVSTYDAHNNNDRKPAVLNIVVNYPPFLSPFAFIVYAAFALLLLSALWKYKRKQNQALATAHQQTLESSDKLKLALSASNSGVWEYDIDKDLLWDNKVDSSATQPIIKSFEEQVALVNPSDKKRYESAWKDFLNTPDVELDITYRLLSKRGDWYWFRDVGKKVKFNDSGAPTVVTGTHTNVTKSMVDKGNLRLFGEAFKNTLDWVIIYDSHYHLVACNDAFKAKLKLENDVEAANKLNSIFDNQPDNAGKTWSKIHNLKAGEHWKGEDKLLLPDDTLCDVLVHIYAVPNELQKDKVENVLVIISDITEQKSAEEKLRTLANYDALTGLPNRTLLLDRIDRGIEHAQREENNLAVFFIDLDKFKQVNDSLGHKAGDALLKSIAERLSRQLRKKDTVARLGGDEFVIMIEDVESIESISHLVSEISTSIDLPVSLGSQTVSVSSSIGISLFPGDGKTADELLRNADIAMYHAKEKGRSNFQFFTQQMDDLVKRKLELENDLKEAHKAKVFENHYQAIINTQSKGIEGFEILMRWESNGEAINPDMFIPTSEELGLIESMTFDAIERAIPILKAIQKKGFTGYMSFNLSAKHFENQSSIYRIIAALEKNNIPVNAIRFEITESALMRDYDSALKYMSYLRKKGFVIALDDFGTGYSSLKYLKEFPINIIKIDKSFVDDIGKNKNNEAIILTTLSMAKQLSMSCIAEGIETLEHVEFFNQHGCPHLQGYYFSRPIPGEQVIPLLEKNWEYLLEKR